MNRNDVITALTGCLDCTRSLKSQIVHISIPTAETILELLKEQEPVKPTRDGNEITWWYKCGSCKTAELIHRINSAGNADGLLIGTCNETEQVATSSQVCCKFVASSPRGSAAHGLNGEIWIRGDTQ